MATALKRMEARPQARYFVIMETIRFFCPSCGARLSTAGRLPPGESIHCPKCGVRFMPPQFQDGFDNMLRSK